MPHSYVLRPKHTDRPVVSTASVITSSSSNISRSDDEEWPIKCILRETAAEYLIDWEGPWSPTWEPKENASEAAVQVWSKYKARNARKLSHSVSPVHSAHSPNSITASSPARTNEGPEGSSNSLPGGVGESGIESRTPSTTSSATKQDLSEYLEDLQSQYLELSTSTCLGEASLSFHSSSEFPPSSEAVSNSSGRQTSPSIVEYIPESPTISEDLIPGVRDSAFFDTLHGGSQCYATQDSNRSCLSESLTQPPHSHQYLADESRTRQSTQPKTSSLEASHAVFEIAETPIQSLIETRLSRLESPSLEHFQLQRHFPPHHLDSSELVIQETPHAQSVYRGSNPETLNQNPPQYSDYLSAGNLTPPMLPLSSLMEPNPPVGTGGKKSKSSDSSSSHQSDRHGDLPGSTPREMIRHTWAQLDSEKQPETPRTGNATDTPSSVGDIEASALAPVPDSVAPLSVRADTDSFSHSHTAVHHGHSGPLLPASELAHEGHLAHHAMQTIQPSALTVTGMEAIAPGSIQLGPSEYAVTLPMDSRVKDDYERVITDASTTIKDFDASFQSDSQLSGSERNELYSSMQDVIFRLNNVALHPDLNIADHLKGLETDLAKEASWAEYSSAKFLFLGNLIELVGVNEMHLIIAVGDEKKQRILERYLQGKGFAYTRPRDEMGSVVEVSLAKGSLSFGIHSSESARELFKSPSAIFALDSTFSPESPSIQHIRTTYARNGNLLPAICFLIANTSEHIERCLNESPGAERLRLLVHNISRLHDEVGDLQDDALGVQEDAEEIIGFLLGTVSAWPLPAIQPLDLITMEELDTLTDSSSDEGRPQAPKRPRDDGSEDFIAKRPRVGTQEDSLLTESTKLSSQTLDRDLQSLEKNLLQMKSIYATEKHELQTELAQANSRWREFEKALGTLQHRYETRTNEFHKVRQERDQLTTSKTTSEERVERQMNIISKLKEERAELNRQLDETRKTLKDGGGSPAELETLREEIRRLTSENESLAHKTRFEQSQSEYIKEQYQNASTTAAQSGTENRLLTTENEALKRKVEGDMVKLHELNTQNTAARQTARIEELEITLAARDEFLRKKEDELREIRKNRPSTRSTSTQPRSPKWAGSRPTSPGVGHNGNGNGGVPGRGSALRYSSEMRL